MLNAKIAGIGYYVPERVVTNEELTHHMETSDEWIQERTGILERRYARKHQETTTTMGAMAAERAIADAGIAKEDVDFIIFATLSPDYFFPGCGVLVQRELGITDTEIGFWIFAINARALYMDFLLLTNLSKLARIKMSF